MPKKNDGEPQTQPRPGWPTKLSDIPEPITQLINQVRNGDAEAREQLWRIFYPILKDKAKLLLRNDDPVAGVMTPSDLIQEAMVQLMKNEKIGWNDRNHLFRFAVRIMRHIIIDYARGPLRRARLTIPISETLNLEFNKDLGPDKLIEIDDLINQLAKIDPVKADIVEMRLYGGMTIEEIADCLGIPVATVKRHMATAQAFIMSKLKLAEKTRKK